MLLTEEKCDIEKLKLLGSEVEMKDLGATMKILGMEIFRDREKKLFLSQQAYINEVLTRFMMSSD
uniref:Reverse transcriptase Ty1/copia-type domain-containing protein n=1 Tax=Brassica oleracea var. oleracea TaxID=109376 RepID=A0A0D3AH95_BRAOL